MNIFGTHPLPGSHPYGHFSKHLMTKKQPIRTLLTSEIIATMLDYANTQTRAFSLAFIKQIADLALEALGLNNLKRQTSEVYINKM